MDDFQQFYDENRERLFGYLLRKCGDRQLAADLAQESFTRCLERPGPASSPLLYTIARNLFYDHCRQGRRDRQMAEPEREAVANEEEIAIAREESQKMFAALRRLGDDDRDLLALVAGSGLSYREIAEIRGCSPANVKVKVHRARQKLQQFSQEKEHG